MRRILTICFLLLMAACGREDVERVAVVLTTDYLDLYGPIEVTMEGEPEVLAVLDGLSSFTCEKPAFYLDKKKQVLEATSANYFSWSPTVQGDSDCNTIHLGLSELASVVAGYVVQEVQCVPMDFTLDGRPLGTVSSTLALEFGPGSPLGKGWLEDVTYLFEEARNGKAVVWGARWPSVVSGTSRDGSCESSFEIRAPLLEQMLLLTG